MRRQRVSAVAIALVLSLAFSESARGEDSGKFAGTLAVAAVGAIVCASLGLGLDQPDGVDEYERKGWFVNLAGTYAVPTFEQGVEDDLGGGASVSVDDSLGMSGGVGYRCHRFLAIEGEIESVNEFQADASLPGQGTVATADLEPLTYTTNVKGYYPLGRFQPFALAGAGLMTAEARVNDPLELGLSDSDELRAFTLRFGAGLDFHATEHIVLNVGADYVLPLGANRDLDYISVGWGVQYRF